MVHGAGAHRPLTKAGIILCKSDRKAAGRVKNATDASEAHVLQLRG